MAKRTRSGAGNRAKPADRTKLTAEESLKRVQEFAARKERFVAAIRKGKDRSVSA
jgi:hypothetical protein